MKDDNSNYLGFAGFFLVIVFLVLLGSIFLYLGKKNNQSNNINKENSLLSSKIKDDQKQDYIYFSDEKTVSDSLPLTYKKAIINIKSDDAKSLNKKLTEKYNNAFKTVINKDDNHQCVNESDIFNSLVIDYTTYYYEGFITLLIRESDYSCNRTINNMPSKIESYTFDGNAGNLIEQEKLLEKFALDQNKVKEIIKNRLYELKTNDESINIDNIINNLKINETYCIYISEEKELVVNYIVKTGTESYNDIIELN